MSFEHGLLKPELCGCFGYLFLFSVQSLTLFLQFQHGIVLEIEVSSGDAGLEFSELMEDGIGVGCLEQIERSQISLFDPRTSPFEGEVRMRTARCQKYGMLRLVTRVTATSGNIDILELGCNDESVAFTSRVSAVDGETCLESMDGKKYAEEVYAFGQVVHLHRLDGLSEVLTPQVAIVSLLPAQNSIHDVDKFMRSNRDDILGLSLRGSVYEIGNETVGGLLTPIKCFSSSFEC